MPAEKRKLIYVWNYLEWGGAQIYFIGIMKLARSEWDITVILPRGSDPRLLAFLDQAGIAYEFLRRHADLTAAPTIRRKLQRRLSIFRSDVEVFWHLIRYDLSKSILHIEAAPWQSWVLLTALAARRANTFVTLHNALPEAPAWRELLWKVKIGVVSRLPRLHIFASNMDTKDRFRRWVSQEFWHTVKVTYTTVNPPEIDAVRGNSAGQTAIRKQFGLVEDDFLVLCLGQFIDRKGRWVFLDAAKIVFASHSNFQFVWVTSSAVSDDDLSRIDGYGLGENFVLLPAARLGEKREDVLSFYTAADVYALPSFVEGLPVALLEAMAMGVASISTSVYAIPEAIKHGETGLLVEPGSAVQLADAIIRLKSDTGMRQKLAVAGREFVIANFDERTASQIAIDAYKECFADGR